LRVFFGHQSVGANVLDGISGVYQDFGVAAPAVNEGMPLPGGSFGNVWIGTNEVPVSKLDELEGWLRERELGAGADVVLMKLCYLDVWRNTDVPAWFSRYRSTMQELERDFPNVTFLHVTTPVTTWTAEDNVARQRLNALMRAEYGPTGRLFDIARVESTRPDGTRVSGNWEGQVYYELYPGYTTDGGHLNADGQKVAATALLETIAANTS
jgi:lysophospholipase L1-like esterase